MILLAVVDTTLCWYHVFDKQLWLAWFRGLHVREADNLLSPLRMLYQLPCRAFIGIPQLVHARSCKCVQMQQ